MPLVQRSFLGGIVSGALWALTSLAKRAYGLRDCVNFFVMANGGVCNRPGSAHIAATKSSGAARYISFAFGGDDGVAMEFGNGYIRFDVAGEQLTVGPTDAPAYSATASYSIGDLVTQTNVIYYCIAPAINIAPGTLTTWYPLTMLSTTVGIYEIPSPWDATDVFDLDYDGYADVMFFVGGDETIYQLKRVEAARWILAPADFVPSLLGPKQIAASSSGTTTTRRYKVISIKKNTEERSFPGNGATVYEGLITNGGAGGILRITAANGLSAGNDVIVVSAHTYGAKDDDFEAKVVARVFDVAAATGANFDLTGTAGIIAPTGADAYSVTVIPVTIGVAANLMQAGLNGGNGATVQPNLTAHGLSTGDEVWVELLSKIFGGDAPQPAVKALVHKTFRVTVIDANNFSLDDTEHVPLSTAMDAYMVRTAVTDTGDSDAIVTLTWKAVPEAQEYWIYKQLNGVFGYIGKTTLLTYADDNGAGSATGESQPATNDTPPRYFNPTNNGEPAAVALMKQRLVIAGGDDTPIEVQFSRSGDVLNYTQSVPISDADSFTYNVQGRLVESIQHLVPLRDLIVLTAGDGWSVSGDRDGQIRAGGVSMDPEAFVGAARVTPVRVGTGCVFVDRVQSRLHEILYGADAGGYVAIDRSEHAPHLVMRKAIADLAYQQSPDSIVFATCDGTLLGLTLISRLDIAAWHRHTTGASGEYESVCVVPAVGGPRVHVIVKRTVNGSTVRHKERFALRDFGAEDYDIDADPFFVDDGVAFDGNADGVTTLKITTATDYLAGSTLTVTAASVPAGTTMFNTWDVGNRLVLVGAGPVTITLTITAYTSATVVSATASVNVPAALQNTTTLLWTRYYHKFGGLTHLEAVPVAVFGDGTDDTVQATALHTVASGVATFTGYYVVGCVGIPIDASFETIGADVGVAPAQKGVTPEVSLLVQQSLGWKAGPAGGTLGAHTPTADDLEDDGMENRWRTVSVNTRAGIHAGGFTVSQKAPFPCAVMAAVADVKFGGGGAGP